jgi:hypothetical protein
MPEKMSEYMPESMSEQRPDKMAETMSETWSKQFARVGSLEVKKIKQLGFDLMIRRSRILNTAKR